MKCPFCNEDDFDAIGLKKHLYVYCDEIRKVEEVPSPVARFVKNVMLDLKDAARAASTEKLGGELGTHNNARADICDKYAKNSACGKGFRTGCDFCALGYVIGRKQSPVA